MEDAQLNMSPVSDLHMGVNTVEAFETWLADGLLQPVGCKPSECRPSRASADVFNCLRPVATPPEPDAVCSIELYAALEDIMDVDSESMAFHDDEFPESTMLQKAAVREKDEKVERKQQVQAVQAQVKPKHTVQRKHVEKSGGADTATAENARIVGKKVVREDADGTARKRKRVEDGNASHEGGSGVARARRMNGEKKAVLGDSDDRNMPVKDKCMRCSTMARNTPMMRKGPDGCRSLCNACGLKWSRHGIY